MRRLMRLGRERAYTLLTPALAVTLLGIGAPATFASPSIGREPMPPTGPNLVEKAHFQMDEEVTSRQVSGGQPQQFTASVAVGAELGAAGKVGTALHLDGSSGYAATFAPMLDTTKSFSVSAWVKLDDKKENCTFLSQAGNHASGFQLYYSKTYDKWVFNRHTNDTDTTQLIRSMSKDAAKAGTWTHLTGSYSAEDQELSLFVNGQLQQSEKFTTPWRAEAGLQLGRLRYKGAWGENAHGAIDDVQLVQSPVSATDAAALGSGEIPDHLQQLANFPLDEKPGSPRVSGGLGAGPVGRLAGRGAELGAAGKVGTALHLDGSSGYAATSGPMLDTTKSFSVSAWVKLDDKKENYTFLSQAGNHASGFQLYYSKTYDKWVFNRHASDTDGTQIIRSMSDTTAVAGTWTQLTGVYDREARTIQLFVNSQPQPQATFTTPWRAQGGLQFGRLYYNDAWHEHLDGTIDDVRISEQDADGPCLAPDAIGHRGAPELAPENTMASLEAAVDGGADWVETDVQFTKDKQPVILHDATVDRTTDGTGRVDQLTAAEVARLTIKGGGRVPTLQQVLNSPKVRSVQLLLEIKGPQSSEEVDLALRMVHETGMAPRTLVQSFDENVVKDVTVSPYRARVGLLRSNVDADPVATAREYSLDAYAVKFKGISDQVEKIGKLKSAGIEVFVWTVDDQSDWQSSVSWGVDGVITNRTHEYLQWRNSSCVGGSEID
ncbi:LamG-like jellyroll fold domain-containing protein [Streptomyces sp. Rer75]|uniref:LamG-like jellyroll fold domain-containing protein n=1 Tax=Streptomyces sp. Rer75 TaxID=2750011 RepID=UPI0015D0248F|nr:glycerophosphodiester phosphodiesterase family protein [Streptomyces sp. Rer75]QLH19343.1 hypothetical protein HYQ63_00415 [Streptomyces sp. Rer75]